MCGTDHKPPRLCGVLTRVNPAEIADDAGNALSSSSDANGRQQFGMHGR
jgi:hypothetical protein